MLSIDWLEKEEWELCKKYMDKETFEEFQMVVKAEEVFSVGIPLPLIAILDVCENAEKYGRMHIKDFRKVYRDFGKTGSYQELYRLLAFTLYGYGNWSNNDRRLKGLKPIRFRKF